MFKIQNMLQWLRIYEISEFFAPALRLFPSEYLFRIMRGLQKRQKCDRTALYNVCVR